MQGAIRCWAMRVRQSPVIVTTLAGCYPNYLDIRRLSRLMNCIGLLLPMRGLLWEPWHAILLEGQSFFEELDLETAS